MRSLCIALFLVLMCAPSVFAAQWKASLKSIIDGQNNTLLFLQYTPPELRFKDFLIEVSFRPIGSLQIIYQKEFSCQVREPKKLIVPFNFPRGEYEVTVDILEQKSSQHTLIKIPYQCTADPRQTSLSDILLSYGPFSSEDRFLEISPTLNPNLRADSLRLFFWMEIYSPKDGPFLGKAVIFRKAVTSKQDSNRVADEATRYTSEDEKFFYPQVVNGKGIYTDWFDVGKLIEGEYQLFVYIYDEDDIFIDDKTVNFIVKGSLKQRILDDVVTSIEMMKYASFSEEKIRELLAITDMEKQQEAFQQAWHQLFSRRTWDGEMEEEAELRMEQYYQRLYDANQVLAQFGEDWSSDRGRIYVQYDEPSLINEVKIKNKTYERWTYGQWDLSFLFERTTDGYILTEQ